MISCRFRHLYFVSILIMFVISPTLYAGDKDWVLLHKGQDGDRDVYYDKSSIARMSDGTTDLFIYWCNAPNKCAIQQVRVDCKNNKTANGLSRVYINDVKTQEMDFSKNGWVWLAPTNNVQKKLIKLVCKKK